MTAGRKPQGISGLAVGAFAVLVVGCGAAEPVLGMVGAIGLRAVLGCGLAALIVLSTGAVSRHRQGDATEAELPRERRWEVGRVRVSLQIAGMTCDACAGRVAGALEQAGATRWRSTGVWVDQA